MTVECGLVLVVVTAAAAATSITSMVVCFAGVCRWVGTRWLNLLLVVRISV